MGLLTIQFGQCGNQIGHALYKYLINDLTESKSQKIPKSINSEYVNLTKNLWFSECKNSQFYPRSVLVDTENKVISQLSKSDGSLIFNNVVAKCEGGSANNWAYGYTLKADTLLNEVKEKVRKELEKSDSITNILSFLSSGGGTGSGTGSRVLESLRSEYPNKIITNVIVLPYKKGEIVTQNYNTLLTLAKLYDITDGNIILENDSLHGICNTLLSIKNVDLHHMNHVIAQKISAVLQPAGENSLENFVSHLASHPSYKFVQIKTTPHVAREHLKFESSQSWDTLVRHMRSVLRSGNQLHWETKTPASAELRRPVVHHCKAVSSLLISRGCELPDNKALDSLRDKELYPSWVPNGNRLMHFHQTRALYESDKFLALATNNNSIVETFDSILQQAWTLFNHKAYLHQYAKYEITETDFEIAFEKMESVLTNYKEL